MHCNLPVKRIYPLKICKEEPNKLSYKFFNTKQQLKLPRSIDLRSKCPSIYDQGDIGSCTAMAFCSLVGSLKPTFDPSRLFLYYMVRSIDHTTETDSGATLSDGIEALRNYGVCAEKLWPYDTKKFTVKPPSICYIDASANKALKVKNIYCTLNGIKTALANGYLCVVGIQIYASFESMSTTLTGIVSMPRPREAYLGGHAVVIVGYNDLKKCWIMRNSWGSTWGDKGYFYLPYNYLLHPKLASDVWIITKMSS
jgi:C1A family cysteine protease